jgi:hypothetical protein
LPLASRFRTRGTHWLSRFDRTQEVHQFGDSVLSLDWVAKRQVCLDLIMTATSHTAAHQVAASDQAADNALCRAFCDAHDRSDIAQPHFGIAHDGEQDVGVVRQERPLPVALRRLLDAGCPISAPRFSRR